MTPAGYEFLDLVEKHVQHILVEGLEQMVVAGQLDVFGSGDIASQEPSGFDRDQRIALAMEDQGRHRDRRQKIADVDLVIRPHQGEDRTRTRDGSLESAEPLQKRFIFDCGSAH